MDFFERVKTAAKARGTTIEYLAGKAGLTRGAWNTYRRRGLLPRADEASAVARELGMTVEYLVDGIEAAALGSADKALLAKAKQYQMVLEDLVVLDESVRNSWVTGIHAAAEEARVRRDAAQAGA